MVEIIKLEFTATGGIYLNCKVPNVSYLKDVYIKKVTIETQDTYTDSGYSGKDIYNTGIKSLSVKELELNIDANELLLPKNSIGNTLFLVYIETEGTPKSDIPCGMDINPTINTLFNKSLFIEKSLSLQSLSKGVCDTHNDLIDYILLFKAFTLASELKDFSRAIYYWRLLNGENKDSSSYGCRCSK